VCSFDLQEDSSVTQNILICSYCTQWLLTHINTKYSTKSQSHNWLMLLPSFIGCHILLISSLRNSKTCCLCDEFDMRFIKRMRVIGLKFLIHVSVCYCHNLGQNNWAMGQPHHHPPGKITFFLKPQTQPSV
jgi:hypothetical protein